MQIETVDRFLPEFADIAKGCANATFYQTQVWLESVARSFPSLGLRFVVASEGGRILGYLPFFVIDYGIARRYWSLPFGTYGGPVVVDDPLISKILVEGYVDLRKERGVHEVGLVDFHNDINVDMVRYDGELTHLLDLSSGFDDIWHNRFERSKRRQTRKAEREGIAVREAASVEDVKRYYRIYAQRAEEWLSFKHPEKLFVELFERGEGSVKLFLALAGEELLGGHLNFYFGDTVIAWNGVTTPDSRSKQASTFLYSACIRHAVDSGYMRYNLGASLAKKPLMAYKESLGGVRYNYRVLRWRSLMGKIASAAKRRIPGR